MAYVGTVSFHDAEGTELATRHYGAAAHEAPTDRLVPMTLPSHAGRLAPRAPADADAGRGGRPGRCARAVEPARRRRRGRTARDPLLRSERSVSPQRPWRTCCGAWNPTPRRARPNCRDGDSLDRNDQAIYRIRAWVRDQHAAALTHNDRSQLDQIAPHLTYLENNASLMRYARLRAVGLPVGSGVTEGACKSVRQDAHEWWRPTLAPHRTLGRPHVTRSSTKATGCPGFGRTVTPSTRHLITPHEKILPVNLLFEKPVQFAPETEYRFMWMVMISDGVVGEVGGNDYFDLAGLDTADIIEFPTDV